MSFKNKEENKMSEIYKIHCYDNFVDGKSAIPYCDDDLLTSDSSNAIVGVLDDINTRLAESIKRMDFTEYIETIPTVEYRSTGYTATERYITLMYTRNGRRHIRKFTVTKENA